ncbi:MAG: retropepsin-like aspartic protease [Oscillochloridaceae bacterium umkhey_bin13]
MLDDQTRFNFPASGITTLPLSFTPQVLRCNAAGPGGHPLRVLLDTGTDPSAIDLGLARRLGLRLGDFAHGQDAASDTVRFTESVLPWLRLGELELRDLYVLALDLSQAPFEVDLVLGYNVLCQLTLTVNYRAEQLQLGHPDLEPLPPGPDGAILPLHFFEHFPALADAHLRCNLPGGPFSELALPLLTIDTGSNGALTLSSDLAAQAGLDYADQVTPGQGRGFVGGVAVRHALAPSLRLGPFELAQVELDAPEAEAGDLGRAGRANLGNRLLARFARMTLDYRRGWCVLDR